MVIPQGNGRVRIYVQIPSDDDSKNLSASASQARIQRMANEILSPYRVEWETVDWHSVYHIGQGISQKYSLNNRIFIGGDACHTHSVSLLQPDLVHIPMYKLTEPAESWSRNELWSAGRP